VALGINLENIRHVLREVEDDGRVTTLSGERCAAAAGQQRSAVVTAQSNYGENVFFVARNYDADWDLTVVGAVGGVEGAAAGVKADLSAKVAAERGFERGGVKLHGMDRRWGDILRHRVVNIFEDVGARRKGIAKSVVVPNSTTTAESKIPYKSEEPE
jgi:hypothetical protein